jgi:hypothetical protein
MSELANTSLLSEDRPGRYSFHDLIRAYAAELLAITDLEIDRQTAPARLLDHYLHSVHAALLEVKPHRRLTAPAPPRPGVTPEQFTDYRSAMSWFISERRVLNAVVSLATDPGFGIPAWQLALPMQPFYRSRGYFHDWADTMGIALEAAGRDADLPGQGHMLRGLAEAADRELGYTTEHAYLDAIFGQVFIRRWWSRRARHGRNWASPRPRWGHHDQAVAERQSCVIFSTFRDPSPSTAVITS